MGVGQGAGHLLPDAGDAEVVRPALTSLGRRERPRPGGRPGDRAPGVTSMMPLPLVAIVDPTMTIASTTRSFNSKQPVISDLAR